MLTKVLLPQVELNMESVTVLRWVVAVGDRVTVDQPILEVETQKASIDVPSPVDGYVRKWCVRPGDEIGEKALLCYVTDASDEPVDEAAMDSMRALSASEVKSRWEGSQDSVSIESEGGPVRAVPAARKLARELSIDLHTLIGTGPNNRITVEDVRAAASSLALPAETASAQENWTALPPARLALIHQMQKSLAEIPQIHVVRQLEVTPLTVKSADETFTHRLILATGKALAQHSALRTTIKAGKVRVLPVNVAVAVKTRDGLLAPVLRNADQLTLEQVSSSVRELTKRAMSNALKREELIDGPFAISNLGMFDVDLFDPFVFYGQTAVMAVGRATQLKGTEPTCGGHVAWFSLAVDHRVVDGAEAARFLQTLQREIAAL